MSAGRPRLVSDQVIIAEAYELLMEHGPGNLTFERLAARVGLVPAALVRRFKNKNQLFVEVDRHGLELTNAKVEAAMERTASPVDAIIAQFTAEMAFASTIERFANGQEFLLMDFRDKDLYTNYRASFEHRHMQVAALLKKAQAEGELEGIEDMAEFARHLEMLLHGAGHVWAMTGEAPIEDYITHHIRFALRPYCKKQPEAIKKSSKENTMNTVTSKDGTKIAFDKIGSGPAIIIVNGAMQYRATDPTLAELARLLAKNFTVYHYDRRGRGESTDTQPYAKEREVEDIAALIEDAGGSAMVLGFSSGGALALEAARSGLNISKLALYEVPFIVNDSRPPVPADYVQHLNQLVKDGKRDEVLLYFMTEAVGLPAEYLGDMNKDPSWPGMLKIAHTIAYDGTFVADFMQGKPLPAGRFSNVTMPALVMDGSKSLPGFMSGAADAIAEQLPHAKRLTLADQDHMVDPKVLAPVVEKFFQE